MRNLKRALSLAVAAVMVIGMTVIGTGASYEDVSSEHNTEAIEVLQAVGVMTGDDQGDFNPDQQVTRGEMAVIMSNLLDLGIANYAGALGKAVDQVPRDNPRYKEFHDLVDSFRYFEPVDQALVAPESLIREFIGGGTYSY